MGVNVLTLISNDNPHNHRVLYIFTDSLLAASVVRITDPLSPQTWDMVASLLYMMMMHGSSSAERISNNNALILRKECFVICARTLERPQ